MTLCIPLCICRLTLACIFSEISTKLLGMPAHPNWPSLTASGPYLMPTGLFCCPVSTVICHSASLFNNSSSVFLLPTPYWSSSAYFRTLRAQAFVWFRAKTDHRDRLLNGPPTQCHKQNGISGRLVTTYFIDMFHPPFEPVSAIGRREVIIYIFCGGGGD